MQCPTNCQICKCLSSPCFDAEESLLVIGSVTEDVALTVYITNTSSGRTEKFSASPDSYGIIFIDMQEAPGFFHPNADYSLWATIADDDFMNNVDISIDSEEYTCLRFSFERVFESGIISELEIQHLEPNI